MQPRRCWPSGFSESSSTANSFISGSDEQVRKESIAVSVRERACHPGGGRDQFRGRSAAIFPPRALLSSDVLERQPDAECGPNPNPPVRPHLNGHLPPHSLPAK